MKWIFWWYLCRLLSALLWMFVLRSVKRNMLGCVWGSNVVKGCWFAFSGEGDGIKVSLLASLFVLVFSTFSSLPLLSSSFMFPCTSSFSSLPPSVFSPSVSCPNPASLSPFACCLARWFFGSPKCRCQCRSALQTSSMWCYATSTGGVLMFWAGCRS